MSDSKFKKLIGNYFFHTGGKNEKKHNYSRQSFSVENSYCFSSPWWLKWKKYYFESIIYDTRYIQTWFINFLWNMSQISNYIRTLFFIENIYVPSIRSIKESFWFISSAQHRKQNKNWLCVVLYKIHMSVRPCLGNSVSRSQRLCALFYELIMVGEFQTL